jgi:D-sedoheptulose 7-phosphate isomerase
MFKKNTDINSFLTIYLDNLYDKLSSISKKELIRVKNKIISKIKSKKKIYVCGNGGSAAIANHYVCDFLKLIRENTNYKPKFYSLNSNSELISAISNDMDYNKIFTYQAETYLDKGDLVIFISSSGNSKNVINLLDYCNTKGIDNIAFTGFSGGYLNKNAKISIHIPANHYGVSEDCHHILMHVIMQNIIYSLKK